MYMYVYIYICYVYIYIYIHTYVELREFVRENWGCIGMHWRSTFKNGTYNGLIGVNADMGPNRNGKSY